MNQGSGVSDVVKETRDDPSLAIWRELATAESQGFDW